MMGSVTTKDIPQSDTGTREEHQQVDVATKVSTQEQKTPQAVPMPRVFNKDQVVYEIKTKSSKSLDLSQHRMGMPAHTLSVTALDIYDIDIKDTENAKSKTKELKRLTKCVGGITLLTNNSLAIIHNSDKCQERHLADTLRYGDRYTVEGRVIETWDVVQKHRLCTFGNLEEYKKEKFYETPMLEGGGTTGLRSLVAAVALKVDSVSIEIAERRYKDLNWRSYDGNVLSFSNNYIINVYRYYNNLYQYYIPKLYRLNSENHKYEYEREFDCGSINSIYGMCKIDDHSFAICGAYARINTYNISNKAILQKWKADADKDPFLHDSGPLYAITTTSTGLLAAASYNNVVYLYDPRSGKGAGKLTGHTKRVVDLAAFPYHEQLASASYDGTTLLWDLKNHSRPLATVAQHKEHPIHLTALPDGRLAIHSDNNLNIHGFEKKSHVVLKDIDIVSMQALPDGQLAVKTRLEKGDKPKFGVSLIQTVEKMRPLEWHDLEPVFTEAFAHNSIQELNLQNANLADRDVPALIERLAKSYLREVDLRHAKISEKGLRELQEGLIKQHVYIRFLHDHVMFNNDLVYRVDFSYYKRLLDKKPDDKEAQTGLTKTIELSRQAVFKQYTQAIEQPETINEILLSKMFNEVCSVADFRFPYTLLNIALSAEGAANKDTLKKYMMDCLEWLANNGVFDRNHMALYKQIMRSVVRKGFITRFKADTLESDAVATRIFSDPRFQELKVKINALQLQINEVDKEVKADIQSLAANVEKLKELMTKKAERGFWAGIAKTVIPFFTHGLLSIVEHVCDFCDLHEMGAALFNRLGGSPENYEKLIAEGKEALNKLGISSEDYHKFIESAKEKLIENLNEKVADYLGVEQEVFVIQWYQVAITMQQPAAMALPDSAQPQHQHTSDEKEHDDPARSASIALSTQYRIEYTELIMGEIIGKGNFGVVYSAIWRSTQVAVKQIQDTHLTQDAVAEMKNDAQKMGFLRSPDIVYFYGYCDHPPQFSLVMEFMPKGSLRSVLRSGQELDWTKRTEIITEIARGVEFLHKQNIEHRDLNSSNVLLTEGLHAKLTDFGLAKVKRETGAKISTTVEMPKGSVEYLAPELFAEDAPFSKACDMYSFGMVAYEVISGKTPFEGTKDSIPLLVARGKRPDIPADAPKKLASLVRFCWNRDSAKRPTATDAVSFLKDAKVEDYEQFAAQQFTPR